MGLEDIAEAVARCVDWSQYCRGMAVDLLRGGCTVVAGRFRLPEMGLRELDWFQDLLEH